MKLIAILALIGTVFACIYGGYQSVRYVRVTFAAHARARLLRESE